MDKQLFDDAIGEVPPSTVDVDAAITRGRRAARLRHVANPVVAAGVAVVLLTGLVAYTMTREDGAGGPVGSQPTSPPVSMSETEVPPSARETKLPPRLPEACKRTDLESAHALNARLTQVATTAFRALRADATLTVNSNNVPGHGPLEFFQVTGSKADTNSPICGPDTYSLARATTKGPEGDGNITIAVQPSYHNGDTPRCEGTATTEETFCKVDTTEAGDVIRKSAESYEGGTSGTRVDIVRADGTSVTITAENIDTTIKSGDGPTAFAPPLTVDQLAAMGIAAGMTLFP